MHQKAKCIPCSYRVLLLPWVSWAIANLFFSHQYFLRVSVNSLEPDLVRNFHLDAITFAAVGASFFYAFMVMQLFCGILIDRYGSRLMLGFGAFLCGVGSLIFSFASDAHYLEFGRVLVGGGAAFAYNGVLTLTRLWFSVDRFAILNGLTLSIGLVGAILGEGPLAGLLKIDNWRSIIFEAGIISLVLSTLIILFVKSRPPWLEEVDPGARSFRQLFPLLKIVLKNSQVWLSGLYAGFIFVPVSTFASMWSIPFLMTTYGWDSDFSGFASSMTFIGMAIGAPLMAWFSNWIQRRVFTLLLAAAFAFVMMTALLYIPNLPTFFVLLLFFLLGVFISVYSLVLVIVRDNTSDDISATAFSFSNFLRLLIGTILIQVIGVVLLQHWDENYRGNPNVYHPTDFRFALSLVSLCLAFAFVTGLFIKEPRE